MQKSPNAEERRRKEEEAEIEALTRHINELNVRRSSLIEDRDRKRESQAQAQGISGSRPAESERATGGNKAGRSKALRQQAARDRRRAEIDRTIAAQRADAQEQRRVVNQQYTSKSMAKLQAIQAEFRELKWSKRQNTRSVTDKFRKVLNIGDCVKALTDGKSYTNIGIVESFSRDCSRVFFVDFRKLKQNRAPANLLIVDLDNDNEFGSR